MPSVRHRRRDLDQTLEVDPSRNVVLFPDKQVLPSAVRTFARGKGANQAVAAARAGAQVAIVACVGEVRAGAATGTAFITLTSAVSSWSTFGRVKTGAVKRAGRRLLRAEKLRRDNPRAQAILERHEVIRLPTD
jgi:hypothetical protein